MTAPAKLRTTARGYQGTVHTIAVGDYAWHDGAFRRVDALHRRSWGTIYAVKYAGVRKFARVQVGLFEVQDLAVDYQEVSV